MWSMRVGDKSMAMMMRNAKALPRGTVIWQSNGRLYMARAGMWDRAGNFMAERPVNGRAGDSLLGRPVRRPVSLASRERITAPR